MKIYVIVLKSLIYYNFDKIMDQLVEIYFLKNIF